MFGYGRNRRYLDHLKVSNKDRNKHKVYKIRKILNDNKMPKIEIYKQGLTKSQACQIEEKLIEKIGRSDQNKGPLTNLTKGGDGNRDWSLDARMALSEKKRGQVLAKDVKTGDVVSIDVSDDRWLKGQFVGVNKDITGITNKNR